MEAQKSAGSRFLAEKLKQHPNIKGFFDVVGSILTFFLGGHVLVWAGQKIIMTAGYVSETVLMFATLWVTSEFVAGQWINALPFMPHDLPTSLNSLSIMAFSLLPELILFSAIVTTFKHWWITCHQPTALARVGAGVWAVLYTVPTAIFLVMTYITLLSLGTAHGNIVDAGMSTIQIRCIAGWVYATVEMIQPSIRKAIAELSGESEPTRTEKQPEPTTPQPEDTRIADLTEAVHNLTQTVHTLSMQQSQTVSRVDKTIDTSTFEELAKLVYTLARDAQEMKVSVTEVHQNILQITQNLYTVHTSGQLSIPEQTTVDIMNTTVDAMDTDESLEDKIRALLEKEPHLSGRAIASRVGCSPTTASKWKVKIEEELQPVGMQQ